MFFHFNKDLNFRISVVIKEVCRVIVSNYLRHPLRIFWNVYTLIFRVASRIG